jgi:multiple sugar transport system permease protein/raffinose/stachyose/melibiose transport system permease protein
MALILHEGRAARTCQSLFYLPDLPVAAVFGQIWIWITSRDGVAHLNMNRIRAGGTHPSLDGRSQYRPRRSVLAGSGSSLGWGWSSFCRDVRGADELTDAAQIDGANYWQNLRYVVVPLLQPSTVVVVALAVINSLKSFDIVYIMTGGGPFHSSDTLAMFMYDESFKKYYMGYGSAISVVLFLIALVVIAFYFRQIRALERIYD